MRADYRIEENKLLEKSRILKSGDYYGIFWILQGNCSYSLRGTSLRLRQEELLVIKPGEQISVHTEARKQAPSYLWLRLSESMLERLSDEEVNFVHAFESISDSCIVLCASTPDSALTKNIARRILAASKEEVICNSMFIRSLITLELVVIVRLLHALLATHRKSRHRKFMLDDIFVFIRDHLSEPIPLLRLEQEFFISHEHIAREFRRQTGQTVHQYILRLRLEKSCQYLRQGDSVGEVWQLCGFNSYSYFHQAFRRCYGMTPMEYGKG